ncbi:MAG: lysylphosphatidylglycerol synthase transmembrane domain-containing protein, partial [Hyphomonadaceae bacterium]
MAVETADPSSAAAPDVFAPSSRPVNWWSVVLKVAISLGAVALVLMNVDLTSALGKLRQQNPWLVAGAVAVMLGQVALGALRWHVIRRGLGAHVAYRNSFDLFYIGGFFSTYVWSAISGDVVRAWLSYRAGVRPSVAINSVVLDRVVIIAGLTVMMLVSTWWFYGHFGFGWETWFPAALAMALLCGITMGALADRLPA